jgi:ABC-2 type transport system ATP-binding protein
MDPQGRDEMLALIGRIHRQLGITVVVSSHLLEDIERVCDYVVMIDRGKLVINGHIDELMQGGGDVIVRIDGDLHELVERLGAKRLTARVNGMDVIVAAPEGGATNAVYDAIRDAVVEMDAPLRLLRGRERSLEDVYIQTVSGLVAAEALVAANGQ